MSWTLPLIARTAPWTSCPLHLLSAVRARTTGAVPTPEAQEDGKET